MSLSSIKKAISNEHPLRLGWHKLKAYLAALRYSFPARHLTIIGITGTDGKTTTVGMVAHILHTHGIPVGSLSTAEVRIKNHSTVNHLQKTSPSPFVVQKFLRKLVTEGCTHAVIECSSHGLLQGRVNFLWPKVGAITNVTPEHLDYHGTMEKYLDAKAILFRSLRADGTKVLNVDDWSFATLDTIPTRRTIAYSVTKQGFDLSGTDIQSSVRETRATVHSRTGRFDLHLPIPGAFNVQNALCAIGCANAAGMRVQDAVKALGTFQSLPGRMERIDEGQPFSVFIDFTVTPNAFEKTLGTIREMVGNDHRVLVLTGSCGNRMKEKRPIIGKICSDLADVVVITDDEPYDEDPQAIIDEIWKGVDQSKTEAHQILDRREAIKFIFGKAQPGDAVLLCGLGSYPSRMMKNGPEPWNEQEIARELLRQ